MARLVVIPSLWDEPGPLSALEAMATGTPIVAYAKGGLAEYVSDARAGVVIAPDVQTLVDATTNLYDDRDRWEHFARSGPEAARATHSIDRYLDSLEHVYHRIASRPRSYPA
jgi:glycosyltransferase involved in cell wall biosynthesis